MEEPKFFEEEYAACEQYKDNDEFYDFVESNREKVYNILESRVEETVELLDDGMVILSEYCSEYNDYFAALAVYTEVYAKRCRETQDRQKSIEELWRGVITLNAARTVHDIPEDDERFKLLDHSLYMPLYKYLWEDFQNIKQNEESK